MALKEEGTLNKYRPYEKMSVGETVAEGWFEGTVASVFGKDNYLIREGNGEVVEVNSCGHLAHKMKKLNVLVGDYIKIVYDGKGLLEKGIFKGKETHQVKFFRDPDLCRRPGQTKMTPAQQTRGPKFKEDKQDDSAQVASFAESLADDDMDI